MKNTTNRMHIRVRISLHYFDVDHFAFKHPIRFCRNFRPRRVAHIAELRAPAH